MVARKTIVNGTPDFNHLSISYTERQNLSMRMSMQRFTRRTNSISKKLENHEAATALYCTQCKFARIHQSLRVTPAMEAGISDHVWSLEEIIDMLKKRTMNAKKKAVLGRIESLEQAISKAEDYLKSGKHAHWIGFRPLFVRKLKDGKELPPHKDWVKNVFLPRMEKALRHAEKIVERVG